MRKNFDFQAVLESARGVDLREPRGFMGVIAAALLVLNLVEMCIRDSSPC